MYGGGMAGFSGEVMDELYTTSMTIPQAVELLRANGWTVIPPASGQIPDPEAGQVWVSPKPRVEPRTVVKIGPHRSYPWSGDKCVHFTTPKRQPDQWGPPCITFETWRELSNFLKCNTAFRAF